MEDIELFEKKLILNKISNAFYELFIRCNYTEADMSLKCNIPYNTLKSYLNRKKTLSISNLVKVLNTFELSYDEFVNCTYDIEVKKSHFKLINYSMNSIYEKIRRIIKKQNIDELTFATTINVSYSTLYRYTHENRTKPRIYVILSIMRQYHYTFEEIVDSNVWIDNN